MLHSQGHLSSSGHSITAAHPSSGSLTKGNQQELFTVCEVRPNIDLFCRGDSVRCVPRNVRMNTLDAFLVVLYATSMTIYTIGLNALLCKKMRYPCKIHHCTKMDAFDRNLEGGPWGLFIGYDQWNQNTVQIARMWELARKGCALVIAVSLASLQINGVSSNILSRTTALSACLCSGTGLVASNWYLYMKSSLRTRQMKAKWIEASHSVKTKNSIDFWTCLALPVSCLAWSMVFCFATLLEVTWINTVKAPGEIDPSAMSTMSAVFLTVFIVGQVVQVYRGVKLLIGM